VQFEVVNRRQQPQPAPTTAMSSIMTAQPSSAISKLSDFVNSNRRALLISLSIAIAATAGTIYLSSSASPDLRDNSSSSRSSKKKKDSKKSKKNRKKNTTLSNPQKVDQPPSSQLSHKSEEDDNEDGQCLVNPLDTYFCILGR
jgi:beta-lactamase regulating signal transducer with metallopeptidase domain